MTIQRAGIEDLQSIFQLVQNTILKVYKSIYTVYEVEFFSALHSKEAIADDISKGLVYILIDKNNILATATVDKNHITRVFVDEKFLRKGYGSKIMDFVEKEIFKYFDDIVLDTSIFAKSFYSKRGYVITSKGSVNLENGKIIEYDIMKKVKGAL